MRNQLKSLPLFSRGRLRGGWLVAAVVICFSSCKFPTQTDDPNIVSNLRFTPSAFDSFTKNTEIQYTLRNPVTVNISIVRKDSSGQEYLVRTIAEEIHETKGTHRHTWLGDTEKGLFAPIGTYIGIIQIESNRFEATVIVFHL
jgi:hypothetical protein